MIHKTHKAFGGMKRNKNILGAALLVAAVLMTGSEAFAQKKNDPKTKNSQSQSTEVKQDKDKTPQVVQFDMVDATKTYPEGNQITYVKAYGLPDDTHIAAMMEKYVIKNMRVKRLKVYFNQDVFLLDADADVKPEHVVDEMNEFLNKYYAEKHDKEKNKDDSKSDRN